MRREPLALHHKPLIQSALEDYHVELSEYCFANLFLFRKKHDYELIIDNALYMQGKTYDGASYIMPLGALAVKDRETLFRLAHHVDFVFPIPESELSLFDSKMYDKTFNDNDSDYLYDIGQMAGYKGRRLSKKRNLTKQFLSLYTPSCLPFTKEHVERARFLLNTWENVHAYPQEESDFAECLEALSLFEELGLEGAFFFCNDETAGFFLGEALGKNLFVIHFAKADTRFKGIYQYMYQAFAQSLIDRFMLLNLEQDLGSDSLRQFKHSYQPIRLAKKWRLQPRF